MLGQGFDFLMERGAKPETLAEIKTAFQGGRRLSRRSTTRACKPVGACSCLCKFWAHETRVSWCRNWCSG